MGIETSLPSTWTNDQEVHQERIKQDHGAWHHQVHDPMNYQSL